MATSKFYNLAKMTTATTGTGTITLGSAVDGFLSFASAGVSNGEVVTYAIVDGTASEIGRGTYTSSGTTLTRTVLDSTNSGSAISLSGSAQVAISIAAEDLAEIGAGRKSIWVGSVNIEAEGSSPASGAGYFDGGSNKSISSWNFDDTIEEKVNFVVAMPASWNAGTVTFQPYWTNQGGSAAQTVVFSMAGVALADGDAIGTSYGTAQTSSDTWLAADDLHIGPESSAITIANTPAAGDLVAFVVTRVVGSDNMTGDAILLGVMLHITTDASTDD